MHDPEFADGNGSLSYRIPLSGLLRKHFSQLASALSMISCAIVSL